jgi:hypothetical protein
MIRTRRQWEDTILARLLALNGERAAA